jgi:hypothetical protein
MSMPFLLIAPVLAFAAKPGSLKDLDKHNGFRDLVLTQRCEDIPDFKGNKLVVKKAATLRTDKEPYAGMIHYRRPQDSLAVGEIELLDIGYSCYMDQLMSVRLLGWGERPAQQLLFTFTTAFGEAPEKDEDIGYWRWDSKRVVLTLQHDRDTDDVTAVFVSKPMLEAKRDNDQLQRESSITDL